MSSIDLLMAVLEKETDFLKFEKVATEVMYEFGYHNIVPFGGYKDKGVDAVEEKFFEGELREKVIFQFTTESNSISKAFKSLKKLYENNIKYTHFVYVTSKKMTTTEKLKIVEEAKKYNIIASCYDQETVCFYLEKNNLEIWNKYYQNPIELFNKKENIDTSLDKIQKIEIMKGSVLYLEYNKSNKNNNSLIKEYIISLCASEYPSSISLEYIQNALKNNIKLSILDSNIELYIKELIKKNLIKKENNNITVSLATAEKYLNFQASIQNKINNIGYKIAQKVKSINNSITDNDYGNIINLTKQYIIEILKRYSIDIVNSIYGENDQQYYDVQEITNLKIFSKIDKNIKTLFICSANEILTSKDKEITETIHYLAMNYITMYALGINPYLNDLYSSNLQGKTFIIDTDFILDTIVVENKDHSVNKNILENIHNSGGIIIIPIECIEECAQHARISINTYNFFGDTLSSIPEDTADQTILNVFVKGYYHAKKTKKYLSYDKFLLNYYDKDNPNGFLIKIIEDDLPFIHIKRLNEIITIDEHSQEYIETFELLKAQSLKSKKTQYRSSSEIDALVTLDTKIFLTAMYKNEYSNKKIPFKLNTYVITKSFSFNISAKIRGIEDNISTTKESLISYFDMFSRKSINKEYISDFIFNPITNFVSFELQDDIKKLAKLGIDLSYLSISRLSYDIDKTLHSLLNGFNEDDINSFIQSEEYDYLIKLVKLKGYKLSPIYEAIYNKNEKNINKIQDELNEQKKKNELLEKKLRRKEKHIKRTSNKNQRKRKH